MVQLSYASSSHHYSLLAVPKLLLAALEAGEDLELRGQTQDAAVLVTKDQTFSLRGVQNSNSLLICQAVHDNQVHITATLHETLEATPVVSRIEKLDSLLAGSEYTGEAQENNRTLVTFVELASNIPASDKAIQQACNEGHVVVHNNYLRIIPYSYLLTTLPVLLAALSIKRVTVDVEPPAKKKTKDLLARSKEEIVPISDTDLDDMLQALDSIDCCESVAKSIVAWFGTPLPKSSTKYSVNIEPIVKNIGVALLDESGYAKQPLDSFLNKWKSLCGECASLCSLNFLTDTALMYETESPPQIQYFNKTRLSSDPATRFGELFGIRPRWIESQIVPFINDLVGGDKKKRETLALKYVRKLKEKDGTIWVARNLWN